MKVVKKHNMNKSQSNQPPSLSLSGVWREAAHNAYHAAKQGGASTVAEVTRACADAAVREVVHWLRHIDRLDEIPGAKVGMPKFNPLWDTATTIENELGSDA